MIWYYVVVFFMLAVEAVVGFGSTSIGIPILSLAIGTEASVALLCASGLLMCFLVLPTQYKKVRVREFLTIIACILPIMPLGYLLYEKLRAYEGILRLIMGTVITFVSLNAIYWRILRKQEKETSRAGMYVALGVGAIVQAMFSTGGALINVYSISKIRDKSEFRATMVAVWITTNVISTVYRVFVLHMYTPTICLNIVYALPLIVVAYLIGNRLHRKIPNGKFVDFIYIIQLLGGLLSVATGIGALI
jgi:hypothetical protein